MTTPIEIPFWLLILLVCCAAYAAAITLLIPGVRWILRRRLNQAISRINDQLRVQIRPFQRARRHALIERLAYDAKVVREIEHTASATGASRELLQAQIYTFAREIVPSFNAYLYFRVGNRVARRVTRFLYRVRLGAADPRSLARVDPEATIVFVMNHRSNIDYLLVSYLVADQVSLSYAVGEWARIFPLQSLIRAMGAFFVRRSSDNPLYRKVLERYVAIAAAEGVAQAVFLEGGLSRDGNMGDAKLGFLDYLLRNFNSKSPRDVVFVPIAINYDRVLEDENMLGWMQAGGAAPGKLYHLRRAIEFLRRNLLVGARVRWRRFGYASVNFGIPLSARDYSRRNEIDFDALDRGERFQHVAAVAAELLERIRHVMPVLPVPLVCAVFVDAEGEPLKSLDIFSRVDALIDRIIEAGAAMKDVEKPRDRTLMEAITSLGARGILLEDNDLFRVNPDRVALLRYYANSLAHWRANDQSSSG